MKIVLIGPPGSGKGTIAQSLEKDFGIKSFSVGAILRKKSKTDKKIDELISNGKMVSNKLASQVVAEHIAGKDCKNGFIIDGYPRSLKQAEDLDKMTKVDYIFFLSVTEEQIYNRILNRLTCDQCGKVFSKLFYNKTVCENCGGKLEIRLDDTPEKIKTRMTIYNKKIKPILDYYGSRAIKIDCTNNPDTTYNKVKKFLKKEVNRSGRKNN